MPPFLNGLLFGLIFIFALGPAFFALIQTSLQQGFVKAVFMAFGILLADVFYVVIVLLGFTKVLQNESTEFWMALVGTTVLLGYATYSWFKTPVISSQEDEETNTQYSYVRSLLKGLLLNGINPLPIVFWATWVGTVSINFDYSFNEQLQFFPGMFVMIISLDISKAFVAHKLKHLITLKFVRKMNRFVAIIVSLFAFRLIYFLIENYA